MKQPNPKHPNLLLIGCMGVGKSTIGRIVSEILEMEFIDTDEAIEKKVGKTIPELFNLYGEQHFRNLEREFIRFALPCHGCVVACGGGLPIPLGMLGLLNEKGKVMALLASAETILKRTETSTHRPLLKGSMEDRIFVIRTLLKERELSYKKAALVVGTDEGSVEEIAQLVIRLYKEDV